MAMTARIPTTRIIEFFSKIWCRVQNDILFSSFSRLNGERRRSRDRRAFFRLAGLHRHPEIVRHDQCPNQKQATTRSPDDIERMHGLNRLDEGIFKKAKRGISKPHQAL